MLERLSKIVPRNVGAYAKTACEKANRIFRSLVSTAKELVFSTANKLASSAKELDSDAIKRLISSTKELVFSAVKNLVNPDKTSYSSTKKIFVFFAAFAFTIAVMGGITTGLNQRQLAVPASEMLQKPDTIGDASNADISQTAYTSQSGSGSIAESAETGIMPYVQPAAVVKEDASSEESTEDAISPPSSQESTAPAAYYHSPAAQAALREQEIIAKQVKADYSGISSKKPEQAPASKAEVSSSESEQASSSEPEEAEKPSKTEKNDGDTKKDGNSGSESAAEEKEEKTDGSSEKASEKDDAKPVEAEKTPASNGMPPQPKNASIASQPGGFIYSDKIPMDYDLQIYTYNKCVERGLEYELILAIIWRESRFTPNAVNYNTNGTRDSGIMQINDANRKWLREQYGIDNLMDPYQNINAGTAMLGMFTAKYGAHYALLAYQFGEAGMKRKIQQGQYTNSHVEVVYRQRDYYRQFV